MTKLQMAIVRVTVGQDQGALAELHGKRRTSTVRDDALHKPEIPLWLTAALPSPFIFNVCWGETSRKQYIPNLKPPTVLLFTLLQLSLISLAGREN